MSDEPIRTRHYTANPWMGGYRWDITHRHGHNVLTFAGDGGSKESLDDLIEILIKVREQIELNKDKKWTVGDTK